LASGDARGAHAESASVGVYDRRWRPHQTAQYLLDAPYETDTYEIPTNRSLLNNRASRDGTSDNQIA